MTNTPDANSKANAESLENSKDAAQNKASQISKSDALSDSSLDEVSGGGWPYVTGSFASGGLKGG